MYRISTLKNVAIQNSKGLTNKEDTTGECQFHFKLQSDVHLILKMHIAHVAIFATKMHKCCDLSDNNNVFVNLDFTNQFKGFSLHTGPAFYGFYLSYPFPGQTKCPIMYK